MASINKRPLKAFVRYDGTGRVISGSLILQANKPKVGNWQEIDAYECCNSTTTTTTTTATPTTTTTTTLPPGVFAYSGSSSESLGDAACSSSTITTVYSSDGTFGEGIFVYTDPGLTTPVAEVNVLLFSYEGNLYAIYIGAVTFVDVCPS
jgi:hypothetical protein